jgi:anaerobic ribonucleoside-triphosphate reductase
MDTKMVTQPKTQTALRVPCEVYSRIVGYLRPVQNWNAGKKQEFKDRKTFIVKADNKQ